MSYRGLLAAAAAIDAHPALKAVSPQAPVVDTFVGDDWHHNGAFFLTHAFFYAPRHGTPRPRSDPGAQLLPRSTSARPTATTSSCASGPLANIDAKYFQGKNSFWNELIGAPDLRRILEGPQPPAALEEHQARRC